MMATGSLASIEPDDKGFWHVNFWLEHPRDPDVSCDGFATTKVGEPLDAAITLARSFNPTRIAVWSKCEACGGSGVWGDTEIDWDTCDECDDGLVCEYI